MDELKISVFIIENYNSHTVQEIADKLNVKHHIVANRIKTLKAQKKILPKTRSWSKKEINFLKENYLLLSTTEIATLVNRTNSEVTTKAHQLKLQKLIQPDAIDIDENEIWLNITIPELSHYYVSCYGRIKNSSNKLMQEQTNEFGYSIVALTEISGRKVTRKIHRLVALAFIEVPNSLKSTPKLTVNHINFNKADNYVNNLEWLTRSENLNHAVKHGKNTMVQDNTKASKKIIIEICERIQAGEKNKFINDSLHNDTLEFNLPDLISRIRNKKAWTKISDTYF